ncbi:MAG: hypothetical protein JWP80_1198 [Pseudomonas sp.]|nr:hypothetical protein [Pseudomonas sp.]
MLVQLIDWKVLMKTLKALLIVTLMSASVSAMAEGGGDRVMARMIAARDATMAHYQQTRDASNVASAQKTKDANAVASDQKSGSEEVKRTN